MKKLFFLLACTLISFVSFAQTIQNGVVQEYNEKDAKTPLEGVELNVRSAGSTVSDKSGNFALSFLTLEPGEKVNVRRIEKLGYEVFNKEAVEQWNINPSTPFVIVMCRSDLFKKIRDNYEKVSSESYARQLKKEEESLFKLKEEGKLREEEYQRQLFELRENYEQQLDNLDNYVDRFSRIDLSELSSVEQEIIELLRSGRIDEAIAKYEEQNYVDQYIREVADIKEVSSAIDKLSSVQSQKELSRDSLYAAIERQINALKLAGGKENFDRIGVILHDVAYADTTDVGNMLKYADYLYDIHGFKEAFPLYGKVKMISQDNIQTYVHVCNRLILITKELEQYDIALLYSEELEHVLLPLKEYYVNEFLGIYFNRALIYSKKHSINEAKSLLEYTISMDLMKQCTPLLKADIICSLCNILDKEHYYDEALAGYREVLNLYKELEDGGEVSNYRLFGIMMNIAQIYEVIDAEGAVGWIESSMQLISKNYEYNPDKYAYDYSNALNTAGNIYSTINKNDEALEFYNRAFETIKHKYDIYPSIYWRSYVRIIGNKATLYTSIDNYSKAIELYEEVIGIVETIQETNYRNRILTESLYNLSFVYCVIEKYETALPLLLEAQEYSLRLFSYNMNYAASIYLNQMNNTAYCFDKLNKFSEAKRQYLEALDILRKYKLEELFKQEYANIIYNLGHHSHHKDEQIDDAINLYLEAYLLYEQLNSDDDLLETAIGLSECFLIKGDVVTAEKWLSIGGNIDKSASHIGWIHTKGMVALNKHNSEEANICKESILSLNPDIDVSEMDLFKLTTGK
jgi:hypothetical protein